MVRWVIAYFFVLFAPLSAEIKAYVTNQASATVSVIDEATNTVTSA